MLSETTACQIFATPTRLPEFLLAANRWQRIDKNLQYDTVIHSEADDIAAFIIDAPGVTYSEAVVTLASDASIAKSIGHSILVPLRVLRLLSSRPFDLNEYRLTFEHDHLADVYKFIQAYGAAPLPSRLLFMSDEQPPWEMMFKVCMQLGKLILEAGLTTPNAALPSNGGTTHQSSNGLFGSKSGGALFGSESGGGLFGSGGASEQASTFGGGSGTFGSSKSSLPSKFGSGAPQSFGGRPESFSSSDAGFGAHSVPLSEVAVLVPLELRNRLLVPNPVLVHHHHSVEDLNRSHRQTSVSVHLQRLPQHLGVQPSARLRSIPHQ